MDKLKAAVEKTKIINVVEKGSSTDAPSSVMVAVRCRPFNQREINQEEEKIVVIKENGYAALKPPDDSMPLREFNFDYTYDDDSVQPTVYQNLGAPLLDKAFGGWNGTIFAYGQTGAGKSFSMTGSSSMPGIIPQMNAEMFDRIAASTAENPDKLFLVTCSFMEIYNEVLYDLLDPTMGARGTNKSRKDSHIDVKEDPKLGVYVAGLQEIGVDTKEKIEKLMDQGNAARAVAATQMNATSSRSHSIFIIRLQQKEVIAGQQKDVRATINLVDLAGSERVAKTGATGDKLKEGANINKSLSALGNVINALAEQAKKPGKKIFIPYRNSKLTRVLQESLGGNSVTVMLAAISPAAYNFEETLNTLQYADRAKAIQLKARKNEQMTEVGKLKAEIEELRAQLAAAAAMGGGGGGGGGGGMTDEEKAEMERQLAERDAMVAQSFEEKERHAREAEEMRQRMVAEQQQLAQQLARKAQEERRSMIDSESEQWVRVLLTETRQRREQNGNFLSEIDHLEASRAALSSRVREQAAFISVLQSHLQKEVIDFLEQDHRSAEADKTHEEQVASKLLLEQMLLKMKSLREELQSQAAIKQELVETLSTMGSAASQQIERLHELIAEEGSELEELRSSLEREVADLQMFCEVAGRHSARAQEAVPIDPRTLEPLVGLANAINRSVSAELTQVQTRLEAVESGKESADDAQKAGMEKRQQVLNKELFVLGDVVTKEELPRVLHGLSQVLQGVVFRLGKRLTQKDKAKEKSMRDKENMIEKIRGESEALRTQLMEENRMLKEEREQLRTSNEQLRTTVDEFSSRAGRQQAANATLQKQLMAAQEQMAAGGGGGLAESLVAAAADAAAAAAATYADLPIPPPAVAATPDGAISIGDEDGEAAGMSSVPEASGASGVVGGPSSTAASPGGASAAVSKAPSAAGAANKAAPASAASTAAAKKENPYLNNLLPTLQLKLNVAEGGTDGAATAAKLAISDQRLGEAEKRLKEMTARAAALAEAKKELEEGELAALRIRASKFEEALKQQDPDAAAKIAASVPKPAPPGGSGGGGAGGPRAIAGGGLSLASLGINLPGEPSAKLASPSKAPTTGVSVAKAPFRSLAESLVANAAANAVKAVGASAVRTKRPSSEKMSLEIPEGAEPGSQLTVTAPSGQEVTITVPEGAEAGQSLEVEVPAAPAGAPAGAAAGETVTLEIPEGAEPGSQLTVTAPSGQEVTITVPEGAEAGQSLEVQLPAAAPAGAETVVMQIPEGAEPGSQLTVTSSTGQQVTITVPEGAEPGQSLEVSMPAPTAPAETVLVSVPEGAEPGTQLTITAPSGQQVTLTVPEGAKPGEQLEVEVPAAVAEMTAEVETAVRQLASHAEALEIKLAQSEQAASELNGAVANQAIALEAAAAAGAGGAGAGGASAAVAAAATEEARARVSELETRLSKAQSELSAARSERIELEHLKMAAEQMALSLKTEKIHLDEQILDAEEQVLVAQEEADAKAAEALAAREAQMKAEIKAEEVLARLKQTDERAHELQAELDKFKRQYEEAHEEVESLESEKYGMVEDIETLEGELEEANESIKRYYEALAEKDAQLARRKEEVEALEKRVQRLAYEKELIELQKNPVEEGGADAIGEVYETVEKQKAELAKRQKEIDKLHAELDTFKYAVDDERPSPGGFKGGGGPGGRGGFAATGEESDDYASALAAQKAGEDSERKRLEKEKEGASRAAEKAANEVRALQQRVQQAEAAMAEAHKLRAQAEADARKKDGEVLQLMAQRDAAQHGGGDEKLQDKVSEMEDELYEVRQSLEEEQDKARELSEELEKLRSASKSGSGELAALQMELEDMREAKEKAEAMLARAMGQ